jgi:hypothetical protein
MSLGRSDYWRTTGSIYNVGNDEMKTMKLFLWILLFSSTAHALPVIPRLGFTGRVAPTQIILPAINGVDAHIGDSIAGYFDNSILSATINGTTFRVENPTVSDIFGDSVIGINFTLYGALQGAADTRMQLQFFAFPTGPNAVTIPASAVSDYHWDRASLYIRSGIREPWCQIDCYPLATGNVYMDGAIDPVTRPLPAPSSLLLLSTGFVVMLLWRRKRRV